MNIIKYKKMKINFNKILWKYFLSADCLNKYLRLNGQAKLNSFFILRMLKGSPLKSKSNMLVHGAGTGQLFSNIEILKELRKYNLTFADINLKYLEKLNEFMNHKHTNYKIKIDDLENTHLKEIFDGVLLVLLLQHLNWEKAINNIIKFNKPSKIYIIIQEKDDINIKIKLPSKIKFFKLFAISKLVQKRRLIKYLSTKKYTLIDEHTEFTSEKKKFTSLIFHKLNLAKNYS